MTRIIQNRQGDVLLVKAEKCLEGKVTAYDRIVIEVGEASGHEHVLIGDVQLVLLDVPQAVPGYMSALATQMVIVKGQAQLAHLVGDTPTTEHDEIIVDEGVYFRLPQYQYTPQKITRVAD